jgi:hypothetical protein
MAHRLHVRGTETTHWQTQLEDAMSRRHAVVMNLAARPAARARALDRRWLYKDDHPRRIDRYVDFFGTGRRDVAAPSPGALRSLA